MKNFLLSLTLVLAAALIIDASAKSQIIDLTGGSTAAPEAPAEPPAPPTVINAAASELQTTIIDAVRQHIREDDSIGPVRRTLRLAVLNRAKPAETVSDYVTAAAIERGIISLPVPPMWTVDPDLPQGSFEIAQLDLDGLLDFIERLMPFIQFIITLFGGFVLCCRRISANSVLEWFSLKEYEA